MFKRFAYLGVITIVCLFTMVEYVQATEEFEIVDPKTDRQVMEGGLVKYRLYTHRRPIFQNETTGKMELRAPEWRAFQAMEGSAIQNDNGYSYTVGEDSNNAIQIKSGNITIDGNTIEETQSNPSLSQSTKDGKLVTNVTNVYPNIDLSFADWGEDRQRNIYINKKISSVADRDKVVFWETYSLPDQTNVYVGQSKLNGSESLTSRKQVRLEMASGEQLSISPAIAFDSKYNTDVYRDLNSKDLEQIVIFDAEQNELKIGLVIEGSYLNSPETVYPVVIDPTYYYCKNTCSHGGITNIYLRNPEDNYNNTLSELYMGYYDNSPGSNVSGACWLSGTNHISRHMILGFDTTVIPSSYVTQSAKVVAFYKQRSYCGIQGSSFNTTAKQIDNYWDLNGSNDPKYSSLMYGLVDASSYTSINPAASAGTQYTWNLSNSIVDKWISSPAWNRGLMIEPSASYNGSYPAPSSWPGETVIFYSTRDNVNTNRWPYAEVIAQATNLQPDLKKVSFSRSSSVTAGDPIQANLTVRNVGLGNAGNHYIRYTLNYGVCDYYNGVVGTYLSNNSGDMYPNDSYTLNKSLPTASNLSGGKYYLAYTIDYFNAVSESDETNNTGCYSVDITGQQPDLTYSSKSVNNGTNVNSGDTITGQVYVDNIGTGTAGASKLNFYWNKDSISYSSSDKIIASAVGSITPSESPNLVNFSFKVPDTTVTGYYFLSFWVDGDEQISETKEYNNKSNWSFSVTGKPDIETYNASIISSGKKYTGNTLDVQTRLYNNSSISFGTINYKMELYDASNPGTYYPLTNLSPSSLSANANFNGFVTLRGKIPSNMPFTGNYKVRVTVDSTSSINESDENNNTADSSNSIEIERYSYSGGGGGGTVDTDKDDDGIDDVDEISGGSSVIVVDDLQLYDTDTINVKNTTYDGITKNTDGDPVSMRTGAFEFDEQDLLLEGKGFPIDLTRMYNSKMYEWNGRFGHGWNFKYNNFFYRDKTTKNVQVYLDNNFSARFTTADGGLTYSPAPGELASFYKDQGSGNYIYKTLEGVQYVFSKKVSDNLSMVEKMIDANGNTLTFNYITTRDVPLLSSILDASGRKVDFIYGVSNTDKWDKVVKISETFTGVSRTLVEYTYDANLDLTKATQYRYYGGQTETIISTYEYSSHLLTKYTNPRGVILYNTYDSKGRVKNQYQNTQDNAGLIYEFTYNDSADPAVSGSAHCTTVKGRRSTAVIDFYTVKMCYDSNEQKIFEEDGEGKSQKWEYNSNGLISKYTDQMSKSTNYDYDSKRRLIKQKDPDSSTHITETIYQYENQFNRVTQKTVSSTLIGGSNLSKVFKYGIDSNGNVVTSTDPMGYYEFFGYDTAGNINMHTDKKGNISTFKYGATGSGNYLTEQSITVTLPDSTTQNIVEKYQYDSYGYRSQLTDANNNVYTYAYDSKGNLRLETDPNSKTASYIYDLNGNKTSEIDKRGKTTNYTYATNLVDSVTKIEKVGSVNIVESKEYSKLGQIVKSTDGENRVTTFEYNFANQLTKKTRPRGSTNYYYYNNGLLFKEVNNDGSQTQYIYDTRGNVNQKRSYIDNLNSYVDEVYLYDGFNRLDFKLDGEGNKTNYNYDLNDNLLSEKDALGNTKIYSYDKNGNKVGVRKPRADNNANLRNSNGHSTSYSYDEANRLIKETNALNKEIVSYYDGVGNLTKRVDRQDNTGTNNSRVYQYTYDKLNRLTKEILPDSASTTYGYDANDNKTSKTDPNGRTTSYTYDDFNHLETETDPAGNKKTYQFDKTGNMTKLIYPDLKETSYKYNVINKLEQITDADSKIRKFTYDDRGNKLTHTDKLGNIASYKYDLLNRLIEETNASSTKTTYTYNKAGKRLTETVNGSRQVKYDYNKINQLTKATHPGTKIESFTYDANGNMATKTDGNSNVIAYSYDALDRLSGKTYSDNSTAVSYTYDNWDNVTRSSNHTGVSDYTYNNVNLLTNARKTMILLASSTKPIIIHDVKRTYYEDGQLKTLTDADNKLFTYHYDNAGRLQSVKYGTTNLAQYSYTKLDRVNNITYGNGVITDYTYDSLHRVNSITVKKGQETLSKQEYLYDAESNRVQLLENGVRTTTYGYDVLGQLTGVDYSDVKLNTGGYDLNFQYDVYGNRQSITNLEGSAVYSYNSNSNELNQLNYNSGRMIVDMIYDGNGSLTKETYKRLGSSYRTATYDWDLENRLKTVSYNNTGGTVTIPDNKLTFAYNDQGNRVMKMSNNDVVYYINNGLTVLNELDENGSLTKSIVQGLEQVAEITAGNTIKYFHQDALGSTILVTDSQGKVDQQYEYDPFGKIIGLLAKDTDSSRYLYTNQEYDPESDLHYYNARYYNPETGRFISKDPIIGIDGDSLSRNRYIYVNNNPLKYVDPTGEGKEWAEQIRILNAQAEMWDKVESVGKFVMGFIPVIGYGMDLFDPIVGSANEERYLAADPLVVYGGVKAKSKISERGKKGEDYLNKTYSGDNQVRKPTSLGVRVTDQVSNDTARESKVGYQSLTKSNKKQIMKDKELLDKKVYKSQEWHFFESPVTGKGGPSKPLYKKLFEKGIKVIKHIF